MTNVPNPLGRCPTLRVVYRILALTVLVLCVIAPARAQITLDAGYSAPANLFSLMDNVAEWWPGFNDPAYRAYWTEMYGWTEEDQRWAAAYRAYRERTYSDPGQAERDPATARDGLFAKRSSVSTEADPLAEHFLAAATIDGALATLDDVADEEDAATLRGFYAHFEPRWRELLEESRDCEGRVQGLRAELSGPEVDAYLERVSGFYGVDAELEFKALYLWWPPVDRTQAEVVGRAFLIRTHPTRHASEGGWSGAAIHEAVHYLSAHQPYAQKQALTEAFLDRCPVQISAFYKVLEEPLAVAWGNAAFAKYGRGRPLDPSANWYWRPLPSVMGRLLWPHVDALYGTDATINDGLVDVAAGYCARLLDVSEQLERRQTTGERGSDD